jgi:hypothetical protein
MRNVQEVVALFGELADDGRLLRITGFFGLPPAAS